MTRVYAKVLGAYSSSYVTSTRPLGATARGAAVLEMPRSRIYRGSRAGSRRRTTP